MPEYKIDRVSRGAVTPFILERHYAKRWPAASWSYGLFKDGNLEGVVLFGRPSMKTVRTGVAGPENEREVWELQRLVLRSNHPSDATRLISGSIDFLIRDLGTEGVVILSFADPEAGHHGGVYQAASFLYLGMTAKKSHWQFVRDFVEEDGQVRKVGMHCAGVVGIFRGHKNRRALLEERYGDAVQWVPRPRKHRYVRIAGSRRYRRAMEGALRYKIQSYPKPNQ